MKTVLLVTRDPELRRTAVEISGRGADYRLTVVRDRPRMERALASKEVAAIVVDQAFYNGTGLDVAIAVARSHPHVPRSLVISNLGMGDAIAAVNEGQVFRLLPWPVTKERLQEVIAASLFQHRREAHAHELAVGACMQREIHAGIDNSAAVSPRAESNTRTAGEVVDVISSLTAVEASRLSDREAQILRAYCEGIPPAQISARIGVSRHATRNHLKSIYRKLRVRSQAELMVKMLKGRDVKGSGRGR